LAEILLGLRPHDVEISHSVGHLCRNFNFRFANNGKTDKFAMRRAIYLAKVNSFTETKIRSGLSTKESL
jgi:hypothetical protein